MRREIILPVWKNVKSEHEECNFIKNSITMRKSYISPNIIVVASIATEICAASERYSTWHVDHNGDHPSDIEKSDDYGKIIYDNGTIPSGISDPFDPENW